MKYSMEREKGIEKHPSPRCTSNLSVSLVACSADIESLISSGTYFNLHAQKAFNVLFKLSLNHDDLIGRSAYAFYCLSVISCVLVLWT
ncbi:hypothetical protein GQ55_9G148300 [Panicum hallii var. hallii]|uniref:Uncharacterized protein n=1 Tax=Panicum hallii var. hallii TaxID=1504633 RepID=A0A2T7C3B2_9POAL|nr:hypothetical protein GQ55_9G148300 [Panicum hallii var. hallii]